MRKLSIVLSMLVLLVASNAMAGGPLAIFDPATQTPYAYPGLVSMYTDNDPMFSLTGPVSNADADARVADGAAQWTGVATSSLTMVVAGDFASIGLPDINLGNLGLVYGAFNGGGYHVIYDHDGSITASLAGPGVLGFSGPEWATGAALDESFAVLNGATVDPGDAMGLWWQGVFTHEFGHGINLAHTQCNGAVVFFGDDEGPAGCALPYGGLPTIAQIETMYPFIDPSFLTGSGPDQGTVDLLDDRSSVSDVYPAGAWPLGYGTISGTIYLPNGVTEITGANVIVRNLADPFGDCSSMLSGAFTQGDLGPDGRYTFNGLTPGQTYVVYVDEIVAGGFSTPPSLLPGPEEFYNAPNETGDSDTDDKCASTGITAILDTNQDADIIFNFELNLGDDSSVEVALPFLFNLCGEDYSSVWVGSNGFVTFGMGNTDFTESIADLMSGPPRIAIMWDDLNPAAGGTITAEQVGADFVITWDGVPEFATTNSNSFTLTLRPDNTFNMDYPGLDATDGLVGRALGNGIGNNPGEVDLSAAAEPITGGPGDAVYELFDPGTNDLSGDNLEWDPCPSFTVVIAPATMGVIYATSGAADGGNLYTIDTSTGAATLIGPIGVPMPGLAINSMGEMWGTARISGDLYRVDAATGQGYFQTTTPGVDFIDCIAFDASDVLYGIGYDPPAFQLRIINTSNGTTTLVGPTNDVWVGLAFHPTNGTLFASVGGFSPVNPDAIATINIGNGATTVIGTTGLGGPIPDVAFDAYGNMYGLKGGGGGTNNLILVNQTNGSGTVIGPTGYPAMSGMASWIEATVPTLLQAFDAKTDENGVTLQWRVHTTGDDLVGFNVRRRDVGGSYGNVLEVLDPSARSFDDQTVVPGKSYVYQLEIVSDNERSFFSDEIEVRVDALKLELAQNHPNPFNPTTTIGYTVPTRAKVSVQIYDVTGRLVATLVDETRDAGRYSAVWNGRSASGDPVGSGVYFYRLNVGKESLTRKMVLLK
ncbi:MAG TPA: T9SS type A sorting domain-containing protein [Candidatus Krumholzibacteria bacterium]|nr:T9SS type A sorting domain-containing protein [Candidatus Krumholzibacteria bacterium]